MPNESTRLMLLFLTTTHRAYFRSNCSSQEDALRRIMVREPIEDSRILLLCTVVLHGRCRGVAT